MFEFIVRLKGTSKHFDVWEIYIIETERDRLKRKTQKIVKDSKR